MNRLPPIARFRLMLLAFITGLVGSGVTAFPLLAELRRLHELFGPGTGGGVAFWVEKIRYGLEDTYSRYPWIAYGTDWLAFGHLVIALFFIGPLFDPRSSKSTLLAGIAACLGVIPLAVICGEIRGIPVLWRLIDCSFGLIGVLPLLYCLRLIPRIRAEAENGIRP